MKQSDFECMEKLRQMDEKLNEARREQAKAVVLMRQMERSTNREKERMDNMLKSCETYYKDHIEKLKSKMVSLEKEKNILMNTLKQTDVNLTSATSNLAKTSNFKITKWLETNNLVELSSTSSAPSSSLPKTKTSENEKPNELTSFWLESKKIETTVEEEETNGEVVVDEQEDEDDEEENEEDNAQNEDMLGTSKNTEILNQIRKIMGNLELSDLDDENDQELESLKIGKY